MRAWYGGFVKKCASCSKDLPEAALHCVFCGAKQPPAPAVQPGLAKTAFGYSANEVMQQLGNPAAPIPNTAPYPPQRAAPSPPQAYQPPPQAYQPPPQAYQPPPQAYQPPPQGGAPTATANAATVFLQNNPPPPQQQAYQPPPQAYQPPPQAYQPPPQAYQPPPQQFQQPPQAMAMPAYQPAPSSGVGPVQGGMGINAPNPHTPPPIAPLPSAPPPYLQAQATVRSGWPIDPWKQSLRLMMFIWGGVLVLAFVTPLSLDPRVFHWDVINSPGDPKIGSLLLGGIAVFSIVLAAIPMISMPRGLLAALLGLAGVFTPVVMAALAENGHLEWRELATMIGSLVLVTGLLVRNEYCDSLLARLLITLGVVGILLQFLVPAHGGIPLVNTFKQLIDAPGKEKIAPIVEIVFIAIVVMSLLAWMPGPATGGAKVFAWLVILWPTAVVQLVVLLVLQEDIVASIKHSPFGALMTWAPSAAYVVLVGYGAATVIGKQLE